MTPENPICIRGTDFIRNGKRILLRGLGAGSWMNLEHFMMGIPGTDHLIKEAFVSIYGKEVAQKILNKFLTSYFTDSDAAFLEELGMNTLRVPVNHHYFMDDQNPSIFREDGFIYLDSIIGLCAKHGIYVIIDMHTSPGGQNPDWHCDTETGIPLFWKYGALQTSFINMWKHIANHYKNNSWVAGYDLLNEPAFIPDKKLFVDFYRQLFSAVRSIDTDHIIFVEGSNFARDFDSLDLSGDQQAAYSFHYYPSVWHPELLREDLNSTKRRELYSDALQDVLKLMEHYNKPLWCGEMGIVFSREHIEFQQELIDLMIGQCEENGISWSFWAYKDAQCMGIVYPDSTTPWMQFTAGIKKVWNQQEEEALSNNLIEKISREYFRPLDEEITYKLQFRLRTIFHTMAVESFLKPALKKISSEKAERMSESFLFENCREWKEITAVLKKYCKKQE